MHLFEKTDTYENIYMQYQMCLEYFPSPSTRASV
jgi:hypothetical protein